MAGQYRSSRNAGRTSRTSRSGRPVNGRDAQAYYIDGNTARKLDVYTGKSRKKEKEAARPEVVRYEKRVAAFDLRYTVFLAVSVVCIIGSCFGYIHARTQLTQAKAVVASLESDLKDAQSVNSTLREGLNPTVDLDEVYRIATKELGMVVADEDQIIYYDSSNSDYIRQYSDIK